MDDIYLDHNATTPMDPRVLEAMLPFLHERFGNAASSHARGRSAKAAIDVAREQVAALANVAVTRVVWTSGSTEAINHVIKALVLREGAKKRKVVYSAGEHKAVIETLFWCSETFGTDLAEAPLLTSGQVNYEALEDLVDRDTLLVAVMAANNETGVVNDIACVAKIAHAADSLYLCDATQQAGKLPLDLAGAEVDFSCLSAHKLYGPQGIGALITAPISRLPFLYPLIHGGGHQGRLRSGTLNLAGIVGFGEAARLASKAIEQGEPDRIGDLRDHLEKLVDKHAAPITIHGKGSVVFRLPNTTNVRIHGVDADALIVNCPSVSMSSGSACTSAVPTPSHVLAAMTVDGADESIRLSLGRTSTRREIEQAAELIGQAAHRIRGIAA